MVSFFSVASLALMLIVVFYFDVFSKLTMIYSILKYFTFVVFLDFIVIKVVIFIHN
jgi:hypothetical protein